MRDELGFLFVERKSAMRWSFERSRPWISKQVLPCIGTSRASDRRRFQVLANGLQLFISVPLGVDCAGFSALRTGGCVAIERSERSTQTIPYDFVDSDRLRSMTLPCETDASMPLSTSVP